MLLRVSPVANCCEYGNEPLVSIKAGNFHGLCTGTEIHCEPLCLAACHITCYIRILLFSHLQPCESVIAADSVIISALCAVNVSVL
jgi:hypothetical protein